MIGCAYAWMFNKYIYVVAMLAIFHYSSSRKVKMTNKLRKVIIELDMGTISMQLINPQAFINYWCSHFARALQPGLLGL